MLLLLTIVCLALACHSKKEVTKQTPKEGSKPYVYEPTEAQLTAGKSKFNDLTKDNLIKGHSIYYGACVRCHEPKDINEFSLDELLGILNHMARKARLSPEEKNDVLCYAVAIKLTESK